MPHYRPVRRSLRLRIRNQLLQTAKVLLLFVTLHQLINPLEPLLPTPADFAHVPICKTEAPHASMPVRRHIDPAVGRRAKKSKDPVLNALMLLVDEYKYTVGAGRTD